MKPLLKCPYPVDDWGREMRNTLRSVLKTLFDRSNGAIAYIYFSGRYDNRAKNYMAVKSSNNPPIIKKEKVQSQLALNFFSG